MLLGSDTVRMKIVGARPNPETDGVDRLESTSNYFIGNQPSGWQTAIPQYGRVRYKNVYPGIDVVYHGADRQLEYDFVLAPGADPGRIELAYEGADRMRVEQNGDLVLEVNGRTLRQLRPKVYQVGNGERHEVAASYRIHSGNRVEFAVANYDRKRELVIDPVIQYSTYLGQEGRDVAISVATDRTGNIYMTGQTTSIRFPTAQSAQNNSGGKLEAFVAKFTGSGEFSWISYVGGRENEVGRSIAVDDSGNVYIVGFTSSDNFPMKSATYPEYKGGAADAFLTKLSSSGQQFLYSTYLGGSGYDDAFGVAVNAQGEAYVAGATESFDFPVRDGFQTGPSGGGADTFVTKIATTRQAVVYSTYVGGNGEDFANGIAIDAAGNAYVTGHTTSRIFPLLQPIQGTMRGVQDAFLYKLNSAGRSLDYSTYLGGSMEDVGFRVAVDNQGAAYVSGYTKSSDFPVQSAVQSTLGGMIDAFVTKVNPAGDAIVYSTYLGGSQDDLAFGNIVVDGGGTAYVSGYTASPNFPSRNPIQSSYGGGKYDAFVARIGPQGNALLYSTLIGGSGEDQAYGLAVDAQGQVVVAGGTASPNFPQANNSYTAGSGEADIFLARLSADASVNFITASQNALTFSYRLGTTTPAQTVTVAASGAPVTFTVGSNQPWLKVVSSATTTPGTLTISIDPATAPTSASASGVITVNAPAASNSPLTIPVTLNVMATPVIASVSPGSVTRAAQDAVVTLTGSGFQNGLSVRVNGTTVPSQFVNATTVQTTLPGSILANAPSLSLVVFNGDGAQSPAFQLPFAAAGPAVAAGSIVNAASGQAGPITPGEIISVMGAGFGPAQPVVASFSNGVLPSILSETRLLVDGNPAPLLSVTANQLSAIVPYSVLGREAVSFELEYKGQRSAPVRISVGPAAPGLFTQNSSGTGPASALNQDSSANSISNPAAIGSVITLFGTGEGLSIPAGLDGRQITDVLPRPVQTVNATIGGVPATVDYAGGSSGTVAGLLQINVHIPAGVTPGPSVPVVINVGGLNSREGVTIAVR
jgi:uncharacterized protein (TIGR03437 family)